MKNIFILPAMLFLFIACKTNSFNEIDVKQLNDVVIDRMENYISQDLPFSALQEFVYLEKEGTEIDASLLEPVKKSIFLKIDELFSNAVKNENYLDAYYIFKSCSIIDYLESFSPWDEKSLLISLIEKKKNSGDLPAVSAFYHQLLDLRNSTEEELISYGIYAGETENKPLLLRISSELEAMDTSFPDAFNRFVIAKENTQDMVKGNVTIWVNRGIKLEGGIGYPDRVIGSGFFIDYRGYIITNYHVIESEVDPEYEGFSRLFVKLPGTANQKIPAVVVGWDISFDIALLKVELDPEYIFYFNGTDMMVPGENIFAIGSPGGLESTLTSGIISAVERRFLQMGDVIQVDVPINHGNSGGPLLNSKGEVIGVVFSGIEQFEGINFAIPSNWVMPLIPKLYEGSAVIHPWLGVAAVSTLKGLEVLYTVPGEPAERGGLQPGDIIVSVNGHRIRELVEFQKEILKLSPESLVKIKYLRDNKENDSLFSLGKRPESPIAFSLERDMDINLIAPLFGLTYEESGSNLWDKNYIINKVYSGFIADETGLSENDPFTILKFIIDTDEKTALLQLRVKKRKAGFLESAIQLGAYIEVDYFI